VTSSLLLSVHACSLLWHLSRSSRCCLLWHRFESFISLSVGRSLHLDGIRLSASSAQYLIRLGFESLRSLRLLDIRFQLLIFLTTHVVDFLLVELTETSQHSLSLLIGLLSLSLEDSLNDFLPQRLDGCAASLHRALRLIDPAQLIHASAYVQGISRVQLYVALGWGIEEMGHEDGAIELGGELLFDGAEDEIAAVRMGDVP